MKGSIFSIDSLIQISEEQGKGSNSIRNYQNQSFHEYQFHNLENLHRDLIESLIHLYKKNIKTKMLDNIISNINKNSACILTFASSLAQLLASFTYFTVSHKHYASQSALLAFLIGKQINNSVTLFTSQNSLNLMSHLIAGEKQIDKLSFTRQVIQKEGIEIKEITSWEATPYQFSPSDCVIIDLFGLSVTDYLPFLISNYESIRKLHKVFFYHNHIQDNEVQNILDKLQGKRQQITILPVQIAPEHPLQVLQNQQDEEIEQLLISFLKEDMNHPEKQDIIIFYPLTLHVKKYINKLQEVLSKNFLKDQVNIITKPHQPLKRLKNNIFLVESNKQLDKWNYDYSNVFYVVDFGYQTKFTYSYQNDCYVRFMGAYDMQQKAQRMSRVGVSRIGRYSAKKTTVRDPSHYADSVQQLSSFCLKMIDYNLSKHLDIGNSRIQNCLIFMQKIGIIKKKVQQFEIIDDKILTLAKQGISPIHAKIILNAISDESLKQNKNRLGNLMIMSTVILKSQGSLRQSKQELQAVAHIKPNGIWRKSGYLESCLQILTKCELIQFRKSRQNSKSETFRRKTSKINQYQYDVFGSLFEIIEPKKKKFEEMDFNDLIRDFTVNQDLLYHIRDQIETLREAFQIQQENITLEREDVDQVIKNLLKLQNKGIAHYSGSRRVGYNIPNESYGVFPDKKSLISQLNERPQFLMLIRLSEHDNRKEILMSNCFNSDLYLQIFGKLPAKRSESMSEAEIQFHGISSSTFEYLWKNNGAQIVKIEKEYQCFIEPNQQMALIVIHCSKEKAQNIKLSFEGILKKIRQKLSNSNKIVHYLGNTNIILGVGGSVKEIVKSGYINKCILGNLHLQTTKQDLQELFEEFFLLKDIKMIDPEPGKFFQSAVIEFFSQRDYFKFKDYYHQCMFFDRLLDVQPVIGQGIKTVNEKNYIQFKWYVWKSHGKALVKYAQSQNAIKANEGFKLNPKLDGANVKITLDLQKDNTIFIDNLNISTDQLYIEEAMKAYGQIKEVEILKTPLKQISGEDSYLENLIKNIIIANAPNNRPIPQFKLFPIQKKKNGLRVCRAMIQDLNMMNIIANELNKKTGKLGEGKLYAQTWFQKTISVPPGSMSIYQQLLEQTLSQAPERPNIESYIEEVGNKKNYIVLKSGIKQVVDMIHQKYNFKLQGYPIPLSEYERSIILTDIGIANLLDLQERYNCKMIVNSLAKSLSVLARDNDVKAIKQQIKLRVQQHFFYRLSINNKCFKFFKNNSDKINEIKANYCLAFVQLQIDTKALLLEGSALNVQKALNYLMHFIESLTVPEQEMINADVCGICCEEPHRPYRLQACSHKFCLDCLLQSINSSLGDMTMFPLKCPHCAIEIVIDDLQTIIEQSQWNKVLTVATNQYVGKRSDVMTFCYTAGCKQINMIQKQYTSCDVCLASYCINCKLPYHPDLTCEQAKVGGDQLFKKYMKENGIRQCPNKNCKIPVVRIDGCYRVTCSRCNKSMCFKCQAEKMIAYDDYNECYKHLNDVHGGYW